MDFVGLPLPIYGTTLCIIYIALNKDVIKFTIVPCTKVKRGVVLTLQSRIEGEDYILVW